MILTLLWGIGVIMLVEGVAYLVAPSLIERVLKIFSWYLSSSKTNAWCPDGFGR